MALCATCFSLIAACCAQTDLEKAKNLATCLDGRYPTLCHKSWLSPTDQQKVESAQRRENLKTCLSGKYPALCNKALLSPEEKSRVAAAEKQENLATCLTGRYPMLCNKQLLSQSELAQVFAAERAENLRTCLTGRFPSLCDYSLLTQEQAAASRKAEQDVGESAARKPKPPQSASARRRSGGCESGHWIESVSDDGEIVKLEDGSIWEVDAADTVDSALWLPTTEIIACDGKLINTDDNEKVAATRIR